MITCMYVYMYVCNPIIKSVANQTNIMLKVLSKYLNIRMFSHAIKLESGLRKKMLLFVLGAWFELIGWY